MNNATSDGKGSRWPCVVNEMEDHRIDDTPETSAGSPSSRARRPGSYYYDDATGYEPYDPAADVDEDEQEDEPTPTDSDRASA